MVLGFLTKREQLRHGECLVATKIYGKLTGVKTNSNQSKFSKRRNPS